LPHLVGRTTRRLLLNSALGRLAAISCLAWASLSNLPDEVLAAILLPPLENRFELPTVADPGSIAGVIALGGGEDRLSESARLARSWPHVRLLVTGAGATEDVLRTIGNVARDRVIVDEAARNTHENAAHSAAILSRLPDRSNHAGRWLVVTSASHMPRAIGAFRNAGIDVEAWPVDRGQTNARVRIATACHEWLGLGWYWLSGWSSSMFPGPADADGNPLLAFASAPRRDSGPARY
jgi:uncharacterized SAM-binding protein YcdF (DUF218 family)